MYSLLTIWDHSNDDALKAFFKAGIVGAIEGDIYDQQTQSHVELRKICLILKT